MTLGDAPAVASIHVTTWQEAYRRILPKAYLDGLEAGRLGRQWGRDITRFNTPGDEAGFLAEVSGRPIGFATAGASLRPAGSGDGEIFMVYVLAEQRRRGVARALMKACADHCLRRGLFSVNVWVLQDNVRGCRVYEALGGRLEGRSRERVGSRLLPLLCYTWDDTAVLANRSGALDRLTRG
jgi:GNAT superfamily N-acetyltransferase